jgi:hypothetical protein
VRYRLLETVRQYGLERLLDAGEAEGVRDRHRDAMLDLVETIAPQLHGPGQRWWLDVLDGEAANLTAALDHAVATDGERALRLAVALTFWWRLRGLLRAGERGFSRALEAADPTPSSLRAYALWGGGYMAGFLGDFAGAFARSEEARAVAEEVGDPAARSGAKAPCGCLVIRLAPVSPWSVSTVSLKPAPRPGTSCMPG